MDAKRKNNSADKDETLAMGIRLRKWREDLGLSISQLSQRLGAASPTVYGYERGQTMMSMERLRDLAEPGDIDLHWLITGKRGVDLVTAKDALQRATLAEIQEELKLRGCMVGSSCRAEAVVFIDCQGNKSKGNKHGR